LLRDRLIKLKPEHEASYRAQWQKAEDELDAMAAKLIGSFQLEDPEDY
jgi:ABC-type Zn uptake system ZnuABC Zn-binding protein ZnuA